jgi:hypothetical protein
MGWVRPGKCPTDPCFGGSICGACETTVGRIKSGKRAVFFQYLSVTMLLFAITAEGGP